MRQELSSKDVGAARDGLQFTDDERLHHDIEAQGILEYDTIVLNGQLDLPLHSQSPLAQFMTEANLVDMLKKTRAEFSVDMESCINNGHPYLFFLWR